MPEVLIGFPRQWVEFVDPADEENLIKADLTWLTSRWTCIFGQGCKGISEKRPDAGCCVHGAHFSERKDRKNVASWVAKLTPDLWQHQKVAAKKGWTQREDGEEKTRVHKGACIFHNDADFAGGGGCALHHLAAQEGVSFIETKPEVCWQLPIRRSYERRSIEDGRDYLVIVISEYTRGDWGQGGHEFPWYCSSNPEAHVGTEPVFESGRDELVALIGEAAYEELARLCRTRMVLLEQGRSPAGLSPHPADPQ
jgi:hypothetical protein